MRRLELFSRLIGDGNCISVSAFILIQYVVLVEMNDENLVSHNYVFAQGKEF